MVDNFNIEDVFSNKNLKPKEKTELISKWVSINLDSIGILVKFASSAKDPVKASCIEALEYLTKDNSDSLDEESFTFVSNCLSENSPRIKWESARVIGNTAKHFINRLDIAIANLLINSEHEGTVVRWSSAYALGEIVKLNTMLNSDLIPAIEAVIKREEKNSIRKIYQDAIKKVVK